MYILKTVQVGNDQEKAQSEKNSHSKNQGGGKKTRMTLRYLLVSRVSGYFPMGGHSVTRTQLNYENVHQVQTSQKFDSKK